MTPEIPLPSTRRRLRPDALAILKAQHTQAGRESGSPEEEREERAERTPEVDLERLVRERQSAGAGGSGGFSPKTEYTVEDVCRMVEISGLRLTRTTQLVNAEEGLQVRVRVPVSHEGETIAYLGQGWSELYWMGAESYRAAQQETIARRNEVIASPPRNRGR